jgi:hypothetical protein
MQCPRCGHLVDIPPLGELAGIDEDGTYKMGVEQLREDPDRLAQQFEVFTQRRVDEHGREKDLRPRQDDFGNLGGPDDFELSETPPPIHAAPKYDPVTGELIRPLEIKDDGPKIDPATIPAASSLLSYARPGAQSFPTRRIIPELFRLTNIAVMLAILAGHAFQQFVLFVAMAGLFLLIPAAFILGMLFFSHYAIIIDDIGREDHDELPRPLRDLGWHDDLWGPFTQFFGSLVICYGPVVAVIWMPLIAAIAWAGTVLIAGTVAFPAVFITMTTSGSVMNLSPDRVLRVIASLGGSYVLAVVLWIASIVIYGGGWLASMMSFRSLFFAPGSLPAYLAPPFWASYPALIVGIVIMHAFCWYLALQYRKHHEEFGWAFQYHAKKDDVTPKRAYPAAPPPIPARNQPVPQRALPVPPSQQH